ncbi:MAG: PAS domain S-box protein [Actinomycetota bacterium]
MSHPDTNARSSDMLMRLALDAAHAGVWEWDVAGNRNIWSDSLWHLYGLPHGSCEPSYEAWISSVHPDDRQRVRALVDAAAAAGGELEAQWRVALPPGEPERWLLGRGQPICGVDGRPLRYIGIVVDVTERVNAEAALKERDTLLHTVIDYAIPDALFLNDDSGRFLDVNQRACDMLGYAKSELLGMSVADIEMDYDLPQAQAEWRHLEPGTISTVLGHHRRKDGGIVPVEIRLNTFKLNGRQLTFASVCDISARVRAQATMRRLAVEATLAEERERRQIAADLHDDLGQMLHLARIRQDALVRTLSEEHQRALAREVTEAIGEASTMIRSLVSQLSPPILSEMGFVPALRWLAGEIGRSHHLAVEIDDDGRPKPLSPAQSSILFRTIRELLINVSKHARTDFARVSLAATDGRLFVSVVDDGVGLADWGQALRARKGFGLLNARERISFLQGSLEVVSRPGRGTEVLLEMPLGLDDGGTP